MPRYHAAARGADILHQVLTEHLATFLDVAEEGGVRVARHVRRELVDYLACGIPKYGFALLRCDGCGTARAVPFSCKGRGFCPSCGGRRMNQAAAHLVDNVFPAVPVRQWALSLSMPLRFRLAWDGARCGEVLATFLSAVFGYYRQTAGMAAARQFHALVVDLVRDRVEALLSRRGLLDEVGEEAAEEEDDAQRLLLAATRAGRAAGGAHTAPRAYPDATATHRALVSIIPQPRRNLTHYHGVFAAAARGRAAIVACGRPPPAPRHDLLLPPQKLAGGANASWIPWATLLFRVFDVHAFACPNCDERMRVHAVVQGVWATTRVLACLGRPPAAA